MVRDRPTPVIPAPDQAQSCLIILASTGESVSIGPLVPVTAPVSHASSQISLSDKAYLCRNMFQVASPAVNLLPVVGYHCIFFNTLAYNLCSGTGKF